MEPMTNSLSCEGVAMRPAELYLPGNGLSPKRLESGRFADKEKGMKPNDGGRAFPWCGDLNETPTINLGMSLRDYFAAKAMQALIAKHGGYNDDMCAPNAIPAFSERAPNIDQVATYAYAQADYMLRARETA